MIVRAWSHACQICCMFYFIQLIHTISITCGPWVRSSSCNGGNHNLYMKFARKQYISSEMYLFGASCDLSFVIWIWVNCIPIFMDKSNKFQRNANIFETIAPIIRKKHLLWANGKYFFGKIFKLKWNLYLLLVKRPYAEPTSFTSN